MNFYEFHGTLQTEMILTIRVDGLTVTSEVVIKYPHRQVKTYKSQEEINAMLATCRKYMIEREISSYTFHGDQIEMEI